jgi:hypothetical protein
MAAEYTPQRMSWLARTIDMYFTHDTLKRAVQIGLSANLEIYSIADNLPAVISDLCRRVNEETDVARLLRGLKEVNPALKLSKTLDDFVAGCDAGTVHPIDALLVSEMPPVPVIDRVSLRSYLQALLAAGSSYRVISVEGPSASGKTHSKCLIHHVARYLGAVPITIVVAREGHSLTLADTMDSIALGLRQSIADVRALFPDSPTDARAAERFVFWISSRTRDFDAAGIQHWIILDGLDRGGAAPVRELLVPHLLQAIADGNLVGVRLFLLGDDALRVGDARRIALHETTRPIEPSEISGFLSSCAEQKGWQISASDLSRLLENIVGGAQWPFDHKALESIRERLEKIVPRLRDPNKPIGELLEKVL